MIDAVVAFEDAIEADDTERRSSKYWLRERRRSSTSSGASASTNILGCGMGESSNESHQAMGRRTSGARRAGSLSPGRGAAVEDRSAKAGKGENRFETTPGHFAFATPMASARTTPLTETTPRTPCFASSPPDEARLENLLAAPIKPNGGRRATTSSANECTPNATPLKLRFDNLDVISPAGLKSNKKRARRVSDHFPAKKSTTPAQRFTRARK